MGKEDISITPKMLNLTNLQERENLNYNESNNLTPIKMLTVKKKNECWWGGEEIETCTLGSVNGRATGLPCDRETVSESCL